MADGDRTCIIDLSGAYRKFRDQGAEWGFERAPPEERDLYDTVTVTVANDAGTTKNFFPVVAGAWPVPQLRSAEPRIVAAQPIPQDELLCIYGVSLEVPQETYGAATSQMGAMLDIVSEAVLDLKFESESQFSKRGAELIKGRAGMLAYVDAGSIVYRGPVERRAGFVMAVPKVVEPAGTLEANLALPTTFATTSVNFALKCILHTWRLRRGAPVAKLTGRARL